MDDDVEPFRLAGRTLFSLGLVRGTEGNLSVFDGDQLRITRMGASLQRLGDGDVVMGPLDGRLPEASSDVEVHRTLYRERGAGAIVHAHPEGTVPDGGGGPGEHGVYVFASSLGDAVDEAVRSARTAGRP